MTKTEQKGIDNDANSNNNNESNDNSLNLSFEDNDVDSPKVLKVLENKEQLKDGKEQGIEHNNQQDIFVDSNKSCLVECYYCDRLIPTTNEEEYLKNVVLTLKISHHISSMTNLNKNNLNPQGKKLEI